MTNHKLVLRTFGGLSLDAPSAGGFSESLFQPKRLGLFSYLVAARPRGFHRREVLLSLFWPEFDEARGRRALSQSLSYLRRHMPDGILISRGSEELAVERTLVKDDVIEFETAVEEGRWIEALALYRGDFLRGFHINGAPGFEAWMSSEGSRLREAAGGAAWALAGDQVTRGALPEAERTAQQAVELAGPRERSVRKFVESLADAGDPAAAVSFFERFRQWLKNDLDLQPTQEFQEFVVGLRRAHDQKLPPGESQGFPEEGSDLSLVDSVPEEDRVGGDFPLPLEAAAQDREEAQGFEESLPADPILPTTFVGRERELGKLEHFLDRALEGNGQVAFVSGEAGAGKTALANEFSRRSAEKHHDLIVASGCGNSLTGTADPYLPFREILAHLTGDVDSSRSVGCLPQNHAGRLRNLIPTSTGAILEQGPQLLDTLVSRTGLEQRISGFVRLRPKEQGKLGAIQDRLRRIRTQPQPYALVHQYIRTLQSLSQAHPLLLILDDLHWADQGSLGLLFQLGRQLHGNRILVLGLFRPSDSVLGQNGTSRSLESVVNELKRRFAEIEIRLDEGSDRSMVDALIDTEPNALGQEFRERVFEQTDGQALFTAELLRTLQDRGSLERDEDGRWIESGAIEWNALPARVEAVVRERIERLPPILRRVLAVAAVEGPEFSIETLSRVLGAEPRDLLEFLSRDLEERHRLVRALGVRPSGTRRLAVYRFRHILFQRFLYGEMDPVQRAILHEDVGSSLESLQGNDSEERSLDLAFHFGAAGVSDKAAKYSLSAGLRALKATGYSEAIAHLESALTHLGSLPSSPERDSMEAEIQLALGTARHLTLTPGSVEALERGLQLAEDLDDGLRLGWALIGLWILAHLSGDNQKAGHLAKRCLEIAGGEEDRSLLVRANEASGRVASVLGDFQGSLEHYRTLLSVYDPKIQAPPFSVPGLEMGSMGKGLLSLSLLPLGFPTQALESSQEAIELAKSRKALVSLTYAHSFSTLARLGRREPELGLFHLDAWRKANIQAGMTAFWRPWIDLFEGRCRSQMGDPEEGIRLTRSGLDELIRRGVKLMVPLFSSWAGKALSLGGRPEEGMRVLDEARADPDASDETWMDSSILNTRGELLLALPDPDPLAAEESFLEAISIAQAQKAKWFELRATTSLTRLLQSQGRSEEGRTLLREVFDWFTEGFETPELKTAADLLSET